MATSSDGTSYKKVARSSRGTRTRRGNAGQTNRFTPRRHDHVAVDRHPNPPSGLPDAFYDLGRRQRPGGRGKARRSSRISAHGVGAVGGVGKSRRTPQEEANGIIDDLKFRLEQRSLREFLGVFKAIDLDRSGTISKEELRVGLERLNYPVSSDEVVDKFMETTLTDFNMGTEPDGSFNFLQYFHEFKKAVAGSASMASATFDSDKWKEIARVQAVKTRAAEALAGGDATSASLPSANTGRTPVATPAPSSTRLPNSGKRVVDPAARLFLQDLGLHVADHDVPTFSNDVKTLFMKLDGEQNGFVPKAKLVSYFAQSRVGWDDLTAARVADLCDAEADGRIQYRNLLNVCSHFRPPIPSEPTRETSSCKRPWEHRRQSKKPGQQPHDANTPVPEVSSLSPSMRSVAASDSWVASPLPPADSAAMSSPRRVGGARAPAVPSLFTPGFPPSKSTPQRTPRRPSGTIAGRILGGSPGRPRHSDRGPTTRSPRERFQEDPDVHCGVQTARPELSPRGDATCAPGSGAWQTQVHTARLTEPDRQCSFYGPPAERFQRSARDRAPFALAGTATSNVGNSESSSLHADNERRQARLGVIQQRTAQRAEDLQHTITERKERAEHLTSARIDAKRKQQERYFMAVLGSQTKTSSDACVGLGRPYESHKPPHMYDSGSVLA